MRRAPRIFQQGAADFGAFFESVSSHETDHLLQFVASGPKSYHFNYGEIGNLAMYGQPYPPVIDFTKITTKALSIWFGEFDTLVSPPDIQAGLSDLRGEFKTRFSQDNLYVLVY